MSLLFPYIMKSFREEPLYTYSLSFNLKAAFEVQIKIIKNYVKMKLKLVTRSH